MRRIAPGCGYWNTTRYPYGGDFRRAGASGEQIKEIIEPCGTREARVRLLNGDTAVVKAEYVTPCEVV